MADLTSAGVVINNKWVEGGVNGKRHTVLDVTFTLAAAGTTSGGALIPASAFGLREFIEAGPMQNTSNNGAFTFLPGTRVVNGITVRDLLIAYGVLDAEGGAPQPRTGTFRGIIRGLRAN